MSEIEKNVRLELTKIVNKDCMSLDPNADLMKALNLDSIDVVELFNIVEDHFNISVPIEKIPKMKTINNIVAIIEEAK